MRTKRPPNRAGGQQPAGLRASAPSRSARWSRCARHIVAAAVLLRLCPPVAAAPANLESIGATTLSGTTEVAVRLSRQVAYQVRTLAPDGDRPYRVYVDFTDTTLTAGATQQRLVASGPVMQIRTGQFTPTQARVVLDLREPAPYRVEVRRKPFRIVFKVGKPSVRGSAGPGGIPTPGPKAAAAPDPKTAPAPDPKAAAGKGQNTYNALSPRAEPAATQSGTRPGRAPRAFTDDHTPARENSKNAILHVGPPFSAPVYIVIDPGHGGNDPGAQSVDGRWEKDIVLDLARELALRIRKRLEVAVVLTREGDETLSMAERVAYARGNESLFISVHANTFSKPSMGGVQTFYAAGGRYGVESRRLARLVHDRVLTAINGSYGSVRDGGVRSRRLAVLRRVLAPALLFETAYISNPVDSCRLADSNYRDATVDGIVDGIADFLSDVPEPESVVAGSRPGVPAKGLRVNGNAAPLYSSQ
jgi:N-acetylmuramoyl-L-alanine amidase